MATIKSYTDLEQSKKLAEILPLESVDCFWDYDEMQKFHRISWFEDGYNKESQLMLNENNVCAWSLAALLGVLKDYTLQTNTDGTVFIVCEGKKPIISDFYNNPVDACVAMVEKLHELNLL